jgi:S-adenosylmethionine/arginine decarboxylase-like enzyme
MKHWGLLSSVDCYNCNLDLIKDADYIRQYVYDLCELIEMKRFGECKIVHFGEDEKVAGFSMTQLIETSLISGHFANISKAAYIDIFSCKEYDPNVVARFTMKRFEAKDLILNVTIRK